MPDTLSISQVLVLIALANAALVLPMAILVKRDFARIGHVSWPVAIWTGIAMHGHALIAFSVAWFDRGSLFPLATWTILSGLGLTLAGAYVIYLGRKAYASVARVYGLKEDKLIERGIYRLSRNPQYFGYWLMFVGAALAAGSFWALVLAGLFAVFMHPYIRFVEEPHLRRHFGEEYKQYCGRVSRYFGKPHRAAVT